MIQLPEGFDSMFRYITVVSQRAEQLITGAKPRAESRHKKFTLIARDEVDAGLVSWRILTPEELEAQRQAMVEQFRTEVGVEAGPRQVRDVLPTGAAGDAPEEVDAAPEGEEDELARLQRLLGIRGPADPGMGLEADETAEVEEETSPRRRSAALEDEADEASYEEEEDYEDSDEGGDRDEETLDLDEEDDESLIEDFGGDEDDEEA